jgi:MFS family permease
MDQTGRAVGVKAFMAALLAACIAYQLNSSMLSPVLATMARQLHTTESTVALSQTIFFTVAAMFSLFLPRLSDIVGRRRLLLLMLIAMTAGTVLGAMAVNVEMLYVARSLQGVAGPVIPICLLMLRSAVSDRTKYGLLLGIGTAVNGGVAGIDVVVGGVVATHLGFRAVFWIIAVVGVIAVGLLRIIAPESRPTPNASMDWAGVAPLTIGVAALLLALDAVQSLSADAADQHGTSA